MEIGGAVKGEKVVNEIDSDIATGTSVATTQVSTAADLAQKELTKKSSTLIKVAKVSGAVGGVLGTVDNALQGINDFSEGRSEEHTSELQSRPHLVCRLLL